MILRKSATLSSGVGPRLCGHVFVSIGLFRSTPVSLTRWCAAGRRRGGALPYEPLPRCSFASDAAYRLAGQAGSVRPTAANSSTRSPKANGMMPRETGGLGDSGAADEPEDEQQHDRPDDGDNETADVPAERGPAPGQQTEEDPAEKGANDADDD